MNQNDKTDLYNLKKYFGDFWPNSYYYNRATGHNTKLGHNRRFDILVESRYGFMG